jgi:hypothetical protein
MMILYITESKLGLNLNVLLETIAVLHASSITSIEDTVGDSKDI